MNDQTPQIVLGIDASTRNVSIALGGTGIQPRMRCWESTRGKPGRLPIEIATLMEEAGVEWEQIARIGVGTGPGMYAGLRVSVTLAQALALPTRIPVVGVNSAQSLLTTMMPDYQDAPAIWVCGDARRDHIWLYTCDTGASACMATERLVPLAALARETAISGTRLISPDYSRLGTRIPLPAGVTWVPQDQFPRADAVIMLAKYTNPVQSPPAIHYIHPAVSGTCR